MDTWTIRSFEQLLILGVIGSSTHPVKDSVLSDTTLSVSGFSSRLIRIREL